MLNWRRVGSRRRGIARQGEVVLLGCLRVLLVTALGVLVRCGLSEELGLRVGGARPFSLLTI